MALHCTAVRQCPRCMLWYTNCLQVNVHKEWPEYEPWLLLRCKCTDLYVLYHNQGCTLYEHVHTTYTCASHVRWILLWCGKMYDAIAMCNKICQTEMKITFNIYDSSYTYQELSTFFDTCIYIYMNKTHPPTPLVFFYFLLRLVWKGVIKCFSPFPSLILWN